MNVGSITPLSAGLPTPALPNTGAAQPLGCGGCGCGGACPKVVDPLRSDALVGSELLK